MSVERDLRSMKTLCALLFTLVVNSPAAVIAINPSSQSVALGNQAVFDVTITGAVRVVGGQTPVDWNQNGTVDRDAVRVDLNSDGSPLLGLPSTLAGFDDWSSLRFNFRDCILCNVASGIANELVVPEQSANELLTGGRDSDGDGTVDIADNCPYVANPSQADVNKNHIGDACEVSQATRVADVNEDGTVDCADLLIVRLKIGSRVGQQMYDAKADLNADGVIDVRDVAGLSRVLPVGTRCTI